jgi:hypothetical protein
MKKLNLLSLLVLLPVLGSCGTESSEEFVPTTDIEKAFASLKANDFSIDYSDKYVNNMWNVRNQKYYFTPYSIQTDGDFGFLGYAQGEDVVYKYNIVDSNIVSGAPMIDQYSGTRYSSLFDYIGGMENFDLSYLPKEKGADGYYIYEFGENASNDKTMCELFLHYSYSSAHMPEELKIKVVKNNVEIIAKTNDYGFDTGVGDNCDYIYANVYDVGYTDNAEIKAYIDDGKTAKTPLDKSFVKFFQPYLNYYNFQVDFDGRGVVNGENQYGRFYYTDYVIYAKSLITNTGAGSMLYCGAVSRFTIDGDVDSTSSKINISYTPTDSDSEFYTDVWSYSTTYNLPGLGYSDIVGYIDETDENTYHITDSEFIVTLADLAAVTISDSMYTKEVVLKILDYEAGDFSISFDLINRTSNTALGNYKAKFHDLNKTSIPAYDRLTSFGKDVSTQSKEDFIEVMNMLKNNNYSMDVLGESGIVKYYYTENYVYYENVSSKSSNGGYMKKTDGSVHSFVITYDDNNVATKITEDTTVDYSSGISFPNSGNFTDLGYPGYLSGNADLFNYDNYEVQKGTGDYYWRNTAKDFAKLTFTYLGLDSYTNILPNGSGFIVGKGEDSYDTRVTMYVNLVSLDGSNKYLQTATMYDINNTNVSIVDTYLGL